MAGIDTAVPVLLFLTVCVMSALYVAWACVASR